MVLGRKGEDDSTIHSTSELNVFSKRLRVKYQAITSELNTMKIQSKSDIGYQILVTDNRKVDSIFYQTNRLVYDIITFLNSYTLI